MSTKIRKNCKQCGKIFYPLLVDVKNGKGFFCKKSCVTKFETQNGSLGEYIKKKRAYKRFVCRVCKKVFEVPIARIKQGKHTGKYCTVRCSLLSRPLTDIEQFVSDFLDKLKVRHIQQFPVKSRSGKFRYVDEYLPKYDLCIEVHGDYWHSTRDAKRRDRKKSKIIAAAGHRLIVVWGSEILKTPEVIEKRIEAAISRLSEDI